MNTTEKKIHFGRVLSELRQIRSISGRELARKAGFSQSHISRFERGDLFPSETHIERIANALDFTSAEQKRLKVLRKLFNSNSTGFLTETDENFADNQLILSDLQDAAFNYKEFQMNVVPSLLQTLQYSTGISSCRHIYTGANRENEQKKTRELRDKSKEFLSDPNKNYSFIIQECALRNRFTSKEVIVQQLAELIELNSKGTFELGILPSWQKLTILPQSSFKIFNDDLILIETSSGFFYNSSEIVIEQHDRLFNSLRSLALYGDACDKELIRILEKYIAKSKRLPKKPDTGIPTHPITTEVMDGPSKNEREPATEIYPEAPATTSQSTEEKPETKRATVVFTYEKKGPMKREDIIIVAFDVSGIIAKDQNKKYLLEVIEDAKRAMGEKETIFLNMPLIDTGNPYHPVKIGLNLQLIRMEDEGKTSPTFVFNCSSNTWTIFLTRIFKALNLNYECNHETPNRLIIKKTEIYPEAPATTSQSTEERVVLLESKKKRIIFTCEKLDDFNLERLMRITLQGLKQLTGNDTSQTAVLDLTIAMVHSLMYALEDMHIAHKLIVETKEEDGSLYTEVFPKEGFYKFYSKIQGEEAKTEVYHSPLFDDLQNEADQKNKPNKENSSSYPSPARNQQHYN
ncbi:MAG: helix-turn-helix domain-containing protein [Candidatus Brocadia sp.]|nr:MAG: helix-turn-helix domain-containing protein [Candidatus Brocadia sp.]